MSGDGRYSSLPEAPRPSSTSWRTETSAPLLGSSRASRGAAAAGSRVDEQSYALPTRSGQSPAPSASTSVGSSAATSSASIPTYRPTMLRTSASTGGGTNNTAVQPRTTIYDDDNRKYGSSSTLAGVVGPELSSTSPSRARHTSTSSVGGRVSGAPLSGPRMTAVRFDQPGGVTGNSRSIHMDVGSSLSDSVPDRHKGGGGGVSGGSSNSLRSSSSTQQGGFSTTTTAASAAVGGGTGSSAISRRQYQEEEATRHYADEEVSEEEDAMPRGPRPSSGLPEAPPSRQTQQSKFQQSVTSHQPQQQRSTSAVYQQQQDRRSINDDGNDDNDDDDYQEAKPRASGHGYGNDAYSSGSTSTMSRAATSVSTRGKPPHSTATSSHSHAAATSSQQQPSGDVKSKKIYGGSGASAPAVRHHPHTTTAGPAGGAAATPTVGGTGLIRDEDLYSDIVFLWLGPEFTTFCKVHTEDERYVLLSHIPGNRAIGGGGNTGGASGANQQLVNLTLTPKQLSVFSEMEPTGALVYQIKKLLQGQALSHLQQSLKNAIRKQLAQYFEYIGDLRKKGRDGNGGISLVELVQASHIAKPQLLQLHQLLVESKTVKGGELVTKLQHLNHQGSRRLASVLECIYLETVQPLLAMTVSWVTRGEVSDPFSEFYIKVNKEVVEESDKYWNHKFTLRAEMLPSSFTTGPIASKICLVGKNVNFIKKCCKAKNWKLDADLIRAAEESTFSSIHSVVDQALEVTNAATYKLLMEGHHLNAMLTDLRAFMLVAHDDLFDPLIDRLVYTFNRTASQLTSATVDEHVQAVLRDLPSWTSKQNQVNVRAIVENRDERVLGWDAFVLHVEIPSPVNHIVDQSAMRNYRRLFKVLWRAKSTDAILKKAWRQNSLLHHEIRTQQRRNKARSQGRPSTTAENAGSSSLSFHHSPENVVRIQELLGVSERLGAELNHFVKNYHSYLIYEAILTCWDKLQKGLQTAKSVDELRSVHDHYQQQLLAYTLLQDECEDAMLVIENIIHCAREYCHLQDRGLMRFFEKGEGDPAKIQAKYLDVADRYRSHVNHLLRILEEQHLTFDFLHFLGLRVNFNSYYRMGEEGADGSAGGPGATTAEW